MRYNTVELAARHRGIYRSFFERSEWAASSPGVFFWAGEHAVLAGSIAICQQVPLRVHVGLERVSRAGRFRIDVAREEAAHQMYDSRTDTFVPFYWPSGHPGEEEPAVNSVYIGPHFLHVLNRIADDLGLKGAYRFCSLHELRRGSAPNWSGAFASAFVGALFSAAGQLERGHKWSEQWWTDSLLLRCNAWAWELERILHGGFASGYGIWCSTAPCDVPQLFAVQWKSNANNGRNPASIDKEERLVDHMDAASRPLCEHLPWVQPPFDYGLIYTGRIKNTATSIRKVDQDARRRLSKGLALAMQNWPSGSGSPFSLQQSPLFAWREAHGGSLDSIVLKGALSDALGISGLRVLDALFGIIGDEAAWGHSLQDLAAAVDTVDGGLRQLGLNWPESDLTRAAVLKALWNDRSSVATKPTGGGAGGYVLFVSPPLGWGDQDGVAAEGTSAARLLDELTKLQEPPFNLGISLDWCRLRHSLDGEDEPSDLVRQEIEIGLSSGVQVIPLLVDGATMPAAGELPSSIAELTSLNALELPNQWWDAAVQKLARTLNDLS